MNFGLFRSFRDYFIFCIILAGSGVIQAVFGVIFAVFGAVSGPIPGAPLGGGPGGFGGVWGEGQSEVGALKSIYFCVF